MPVFFWVCLSSRALLKPKDRESWKAQNAALNAAVAFLIGSELQMETPRQTTVMLGFLEITWGVWFSGMLGCCEQLGALNLFSQPLVWAAVGALVSLTSLLWTFPWGSEEEERLDVERHHCHRLLWGSQWIVPLPLGALRGMRLNS